MNGTETVLVVAAHPDDETLGCGGAAARHAAEGCDVFALHLTDGVGARRQEGRDEAAQVRRRAADEAARVLDFEWVNRGTFPDNAIDSVPLLDVVQFIEEAKRETRPELVYTHHPGDLNIDHRIAFEAVLTAFRPQPGEETREIRTFEVPSATEWGHASLGEAFQPSLFVDISDYWETKVQALRCYDEELREPPHPRSMGAVDALTRMRGAEAGLPRAEAFGTVRRIVR